MLAATPTDSARFGVIIHKSFEYQFEVMEYLDAPWWDKRCD